MTLSTLAAADEAPNTLALVGGGRTWTFGELAVAVRARALGLRASGLRAGERLAVVGRTDTSTVVTVLAAIELGVPLVLLHPRGTPEEEVRALRIARPVRRLEGEPSAEGTLALAEPADYATLAVVFTSGSSGEAKGAVLSRRAFVRAAEASAAVLGWRDGDAWLCPMPLAHVGGLSIVIRALLARRAIVLPAPGAFDAPGFVAHAAATRTTLVSVVPTMLARIVEAALPPPPSVRAVLVGGAACPARILSAAAALGWPLRTTYGLTEACAQVTTARSDVSDPSDGCGPPLPGVELRITDERIHVRTPSAMDGFLVDGRLVTATDRDGFYDTGDDGRLDAEGRLHVLGRRTDLVVTGGENVRPAEVEAALEAIRGVRAACVFGAPDERWGHVVTAAIVPDVDAPSDTEILDALRGHLAAFKLPKQLVRVDALPLLPNGKPDRRAAAALAS